MRDTNENMIELLEVTSVNNIHSALIRKTLIQENIKVRFGVSLLDYNFLKKILNFRPFDNSGFSPYRYYFALSYRKDTENTELCYIKIRIEQQDKHKQFEFLITQKLMSNILWFHSLTEKKEIETMIEK